MKQSGGALGRAAAGSRGGAGVTADSKLGRAYGNLVGDVGDASYVLDVHSGSS